MKLKLAVGMVGVLMILTMGGCKENQESLDPVVSGKDTQISEPVKGTFDIEYVRTQINIKGQPFTIPVVLKNLEKGWTYDIWDEEDIYLDEGLTLADMYYEDKEMFLATLENYYMKSEKEAIIFNLTIDTDDCSIDNLTPLKSTKQDVVDQYGEPDKIRESGAYIYGTTNDTDWLGGRLNEHRINIVFDENDIISNISITYADLTKEG